MARVGFTIVDFEVFKVPGFNERMQQLYAIVRPKLLRLGAELAPELTRRLRSEFYPHVAKHQRRTINPPPETWAAWGPSPRGYKRFGYLALCISSVGLHARCVVKAEADHRPAMSAKLKADAGRLVRDFEGTRIARYDNWDFARVPQGQRADRAMFAETLAANLAKKTGSIDLGFGWPVKEAIRLDRGELLDAFRELEPLYRTLRESA